MDKSMNVHNVIWNRHELVFSFCFRLLEIVWTKIRGKMKSYASVKIEKFLKMIASFSRSFHSNEQKRLTKMKPLFRYLNELKCENNDEKFTIFFSLTLANWVCRAEIMSFLFLRRIYEAANICHALQNDSLNGW